MVETRLDGFIAHFNVSDPPHSHSFMFSFRACRAGFLPLLVIASLLFSGCGDQQLEKQSREQETEIKALQLRIAALESELSTMPADATAALEEARRKLKEQLDETGKLEEEVRELEARKARLEKALDETKRKYPQGNPFPRPTQTR